MRRIVVFDSGWGGELVADFLMRELGVVEIIRVIDWAREIYADQEINLNEAKRRLSPYIGAVDLIVLGGYTVGMMLAELREAYPEQRFVAPSINYDKMLRARQYPGKVAVLMNGMLRDSDMFQELRDKLPYSTIVLPECTGWEDLIDNNLMTREIVQTELAWDFEIRPSLKSELDAKRAKTSEFSALDVLAEKSSDKRALMRAIRNFGSAAEQASLDEEDAALEVKRAQAEILANETDRVRIRPDLVLLLDTHFWEIRAEIERSLGWQVRILDFREKLLHDVCAALKLRGVDGERPK